MTLSQGNYIVEYHANATGITDRATLAAYLGGTEIPQTLSVATAGAGTDVVPLSGKAVITVPAGGSTLDVRNGGANAFTADNLSVTVTPL